MSALLRVAVVDYGRGNIHSVLKALRHLGAVADPVSEPDQLATYPAAILPGVGAFADAMASLRRQGLDQALRRHARSGRPLLGICLGLQLLLEKGAEGGEHQGLALLEGEVRLLRTAGAKSPHTGWNTVEQPRSSPLPTPLLSGIPAGAHFYFVHSYAAFPARHADWLGETTYGETFAAAAGRDVVFGTQFHPEKSGRDGLRLLANFIRIAGGTARC